MNPNIELLPFAIQKIIFEYKPNLQKIKFFSKIQKHLKNRYCDKCGEYIDYPKNIYQKYPRHFYHHKNRFNHSKYKYMIISPTIHLNFEKLDKYQYTKNEYITLLDRDIITDIQLICRINSVRYYYNFKRLLNNKSRIITSMYNIAIFNINYNYEIYTIDYFKDIFKINNIDRIQIINLEDRLYIDHLENIKYIYKYIYINYPYWIGYLLKFIYKNKIILKELIEYDARLIMSIILLDYSCPSKILFDILDLDIKYVEFINERKLKQLFDKNPRYFMNKNQNDQYYLVDSLNDTLDIRISIFD